MRVELTDCSAVTPEDPPRVRDRLREAVLERDAIGGGVELGVGDEPHFEQAGAEV